VFQLPHAIFVRNDGKSLVKMIWANKTHSTPNEFTVSVERGKKVLDRVGDHQNWQIPWISGYIGDRGLDVGEVHGLRVPFEIRIGGDGSNKLFGRVIEAHAGQTLQLRVRAQTGSERQRNEGGVLPESGNIKFTVADAKSDQHLIKSD